MRPRCRGLAWQAQRSSAWPWEAYDRICLEDFRQTCLGRVVGVWGRRGFIDSLIFYGSKFNFRWFGCHPGCNELRKYNPVLQLSKMSRNSINPFKDQNCDMMTTRIEGDISHWWIQGERSLALYLLLFTSSIEKKKAFDREHYSSKGLHFEFHLFSEVRLFLCRVLLFICFIYIPVVRCYHILSSIVKKNDSSFFVLVQGVFVLVHGVLDLRFWIFVLETPDLLELRW